MYVKKIRLLFNTNKSISPKELGINRRRKINLHFYGHVCVKKNQQKNKILKRNFQAFVHCQIWLTPHPK